MSRVELCGRCIKTDISGDNADPYYYDRYFGDGAFQKVVDTCLVN